MDNCVIFYFHGGDSYYLPYTINQTIKYNPDNRIVFLGDERNSHVSKFGIEHVNYSDYFENSNRLTALYKHMSPNSEYTELKCLQRWICVAEYCEKNQIYSPIVVMDSDVLVYESFDHYMGKYFADKEMGVCGEFGPGYVMFSNKEVIKRLAQFILSHYQQPDKFLKLQQEYERLKSIGSSEGISDMTLIDRFIKEEKIVTIDLCEVRDDSCFDNHLGKIDPRFPLNKKGIKSITMKKGIPYCKNVRTGKEVRLFSLHFQGARKEFMYRYFTGDKKNVQALPLAVFRQLFQITKRKVKIFLKKKKG